MAARLLDRPPGELGLRQEALDLAPVPENAHDRAIEGAGLRIELWRQDYNRNRPHGAPGNLTSSEYAAASQNKAPGAPLF